MEGIGIQFKNAFHQGILCKFDLMPRKSLLECIKLMFKLFRRKSFLQNQEISKIQNKMKRAKKIKNVKKWS